MWLTTKRKWNNILQWHQKIIQKLQINKQKQEKNCPSNFISCYHCTSFKVQRWNVKIRVRIIGFVVDLKLFSDKVLNRIIFIQVLNIPRLRIGLDRLVGSFSGWTSTGVVSGSLVCLVPLKVIPRSGSGDWKILLFFHLLTLLSRWTNSPILPRCLFNISRVKSGIPL